MSAEPRGFFVTGTDTGIGKTRVALALMHQLRSRGRVVLGMKPVATGCEWFDGRLMNDDALRLQRAGSRDLPYEWVNPYAFEPPISPHLAAKAAGSVVDLEMIRLRYQALREASESVIVEGVGGWEAPLTDRQRVSDLARILQLPVILVVGLRLGCLNHAILSEGAIIAAGVPYRGWCANAFSPDCTEVAAYLATLETLLSGACLGGLPYRPGDVHVQRHNGFDAELVV